MKIKEKLSIVSKILKEIWESYSWKEKIIIKAILFMSGFFFLLGFGLQLMSYFLR